MLWHGLSSLGWDFSVVSLQTTSTRACVNFTRTVKVRDGCLPLQIFVQHVNSYPRLEDVSGAQSAVVQPFCYVPPTGSAQALPNTNSTELNSTHITCLPEALIINDMATAIVRPSGVSYRLYERGSAYWCRAYASMACLSASGPEQCVKELLGAGAGPSTNASNITIGEGSPPSGGSGGGSSPVLLPAVLTGVLTLGFISGVVWCLHRRGKIKRGSSMGHEPGAQGDVEGGMGNRVGHALARLLPRSVRDAHRQAVNVQGYVPVVSKEALDRIAKVRAELSSKMVVASSSDDLSDVRSTQLVGKGTFGRVYKGEWKGVTVALKVISVPVSQYGQAQWQQVLGEAAIATLLNHPCVLQTYSVALLEYSPARKPGSVAPSEECNNGSGPLAALANGGNSGGPVQNSGELMDSEMVPFYLLKMVSEFCEGGSVVNALRTMRFYDSVGGGTVRLPAILDIAAQVASGMAYLHSANIIHADLKAANVLLKQQPGSGKLQAKVSDFGLSFRLEDPEATHATKGQLGSITHMAPEVLVQGRVSKASDVYSFGILLYELYTGQQAYWDVPPPMLAYHVATTGGRPMLPPHCPTGFRGLAKACWAAEVSERPTFAQIYQTLQALSEEATNLTGRSRPESPTAAPEAAAIAAANLAAAAAKAPLATGQDRIVPVAAPLPLPAPAAACVTSTEPGVATLEPGSYVVPVPAEAGRLGALLNGGLVAPPPSDASASIAPCPEGRYPPFHTGAGTAPAPDSAAMAGLHGAVDGVGAPAPVRATSEGLNATGGAAAGVRLALAPPPTGAAIEEVEEVAVLSASQAARQLEEGEVHRGA
ncbi:hypothetical protein HYH03_011197 [Edaphochlamys debaryana]|uniref:Protein kinase domain-containing protein n=1 Tax=Edaphochlamys debaryana TaxID=47281 RepID=A0A835XSI1_9CHLO|nr:hypothetical protein HYH03_011197 [Edaphochlamys debaryana]|eukprot:KAG2490397.1 hypothetical protein HYH03_011197 [Edaphochlamys debaryana]